MNVAPMRAYSTTTPVSRFATSSMRAGGNDHSLPRMSPPRLDAGRVTRAMSVVSSDILADHLLPVWPIVRPTIPDAQGVADALVPQESRDRLVVGVGRVGAADRQDDVLPAERLQPAWVVLQGQKLGGIAGVDVVVRV